MTEHAVRTEDLAAIAEDVLTNPKWDMEVCERGSCLAPTTHLLARGISDLLDERELLHEVVGYARAYRKLGEQAAPELDWALGRLDEE